MKKLILTILLFFSNYNYCPPLPLPNSFGGWALIISCGIVDGLIIAPCQKLKQKISPSLYGRFGVCDRLYDINHYTYESLEPALKQLQTIFPNTENLDSTIENLNEEQLSHIANLSEKFVWYTDPVEFKSDHATFHTKLKTVLSRAKRTKDDIPDTAQKMIDRLTLIDKYGPIINKILKIHNPFFEAFHRQQLIQEEWSHALSIIEQNSELNTDQLFELYKEISDSKHGLSRPFWLAKEAFDAAKKADKYPNIKKQLKDHAAIVVALYSKVKSKHKHELEEKIKSKTNEVKDLENTLATSTDYRNKNLEDRRKIRITEIEHLVRKRSLEDLYKNSEDCEKTFNKLENELARL